jgi:MFS family permease
MYCISFLQGMVFYASIATLYRTSSGLNLFSISLIESICCTLMIILEIPWGILADRIGYRNTMIICTFLYFVSKIVFWTASNFLMFLIERVILSVVYSGLSGVDSSIIYLSSEKDQSQHSFGIYAALGTAGLILSAGICSMTVGTDYRFAGLLTIFPYDIAAILSLFLTEVKEENKEKESFSKIITVLNAPMQNHQLMYLIIGGGFMSEAVHMLTVFLNQPKYSAIGMNTSFISGAYIGMTIISLLGIYSDKLSKRYGHKRTGRGLYVIIILASILLSLTQLPVTAVTCIAFIKLSDALIQPLLLQSEHNLIHSANRATVVSAGALITDIIVIFIDLIMGKIADININYSILAGSFFITFGLGMFMMSFKKSNAS